MRGMKDAKSMPQKRRGDTEKMFGPLREKREDRREMRDERDKLRPKMRPQEVLKRSRDAAGPRGAQAASEGGVGKQRVSPKKRPTSFRESVSKSF